MLNLSPEVAASIVNGVLNVIATLIPSLVGLYISRKFFSRKMADKACLNALKEIAFLQAVEKAAVELSGLNRVHLRNYAREKSGVDSTQKFRPSELKRKTEVFQNRVDSDRYIF
ncbi:hypothetical protein [Vibrio agarivorans]|uniref:MotA/TolQ/ExbB proton channel domain-containing protein n=1 Tax=Vibrio agarivorans TaxID=153622 RepID=A0ABT7Y744_9VIBR|nr:hypothetical protein [Vibrio agarivorans]MDN2483883.1 hypothetical protein [Vibrio agarivorans]